MYIFRRFFFHHLYRCVSARRTIAKHCHASIVVSFSPNAQRLYWWRTHTHTRARARMYMAIPLDSGMRNSQFTLPQCSQSSVRSLHSTHTFVHQPEQRWNTAPFSLRNTCPTCICAMCVCMCVHCTGLPVRTTYVCLMPVRNVAAF